MFYTGVMGTTRQSDDSKPSTHSVVCLTKYIPYPGITHAGGEYLQAHLAVLRTLASVEVVAPATPLNRDALLRSQPDDDASLLVAARPRLRGMLFKWFQIEATLAGCAMYWPIRRLFRSKRAPWQRLAAAEVIEFQWSEMISLAPAVRRQLPDSRLIGVAHDINTQRWQRQVTAERSWGRRTLAKFVSVRTRIQEARAFSALDMLIVFSDKDAVLAREIAPTTRVEVVRPGFASKAASRAPDAANPIALFVGAMNRPENWMAALWFVEEIWPVVHAAVPNAQFMVAGANPPAQLVEALRAAPHVELTGFVDSLEPWYSRATVCVVPLRSGAGVKFKTIDAMLAGVPVVTTTVGAEGIDAAELFVAMTDDASEFARATIAALTEAHTAQTSKAQRWAEAMYSEASFAARLEEVYTSVW